MHHIFVAFIQTKLSQFKKKNALATLEQIDPPERTFSLSFLALSLVEVFLAFALFLLAEVFLILLVYIFFFLAISAIFLGLYLSSFAV